MLGGLEAGKLENLKGCIILSLPAFWPHSFPAPWPVSCFRGDLINSAY